MREARLDPVEDADCRERARIAGTTLRHAAAEHMLGPVGDHIHVGLARPDITLITDPPAREPGHLAAQSSATSRSETSIT